MAHGWESKAVADQIEEGKSRQQQPAKTEATRKQRVLKERLNSLQLFRSRLLQQLDTLGTRHLATFYLMV